MNLIAVGLIIILLVVMVYVYYYFNPSLLNNGDLIDLSQNPQFTIKLDSEVVNSKRYFYEGWLRIDKNPDFNKTYVVFNRGQDFIVAITGHKLSILYAKKRDTSTTEKIDPNKGEVLSGSFTVMDIARNFPFQKWTYFCINVDGNTMDTYLDGKLTKSITKPTITINSIDKPGSGTYTTTTDKLLFTTFNSLDTISVGNATLNGGIARFRFETGNMDPQTVWNSYSMGSGVTDSDDSATDEYHGKIKLTKHDKDKRVISLF